MKRICFFVISFILSSFFCFAQQSVSLNNVSIRLDHALRESPLIIEGTVIAKESFYDKDKRRIYTSNLLNISQVLRGDILKGTISIITEGGTIDDMIVIPSHVLELNIGSKGIFFCRSLSVDNLPDSDKYRVMVEPNEDDFIQYDKQKVNGAAFGFGSSFDSFNDLQQALKSYANIKPYIAPIDPVIALPARLADNKDTTGWYKKIKAREDSIFSILSLKYGKSLNGGSIDKPLGNGGTLKLTFENPVQIGANFEFDIMLESTTQEYIDHVYTFIEFNSQAFGTKLYTNNNVVVTLGNDVDPNDYDLIVWDPSAKTNGLGISVGANWDPSPNRLLSTRKIQLVHVKIKNVTCAQSAQIKFYDWAGMENSTISAPNAVYVPTPPYFYFDSWTAYDFTSTLNYVMCYPSIASISPMAISAGTNSVLTIQGNNFGTQLGCVYFMNANDGGQTYLQAFDATDVVSWTNTTIQMKVPSIFYYSSSSPGTGTIKVIRSDNLSTQSNGNNPLTIKYSLGNMFQSTNSPKEFVNVASPATTPGKIVFYASQEVYNKPGLVDLIKEALKHWRCAAMIDVSLSPVVFGSDVGVDNEESTITLEPLATSIIAQTTRSNVSCGADYFTKSSDIRINETLFTNNEMCLALPGSDVPAGQYDVFEALVHELGHALCLNHVNDYTDVMWFAGSKNNIIPSYDRRDLFKGPWTLDGAADVLTKSLAKNITCNATVKKTVKVQNCNITGIENFSIYTDEVKVYPNMVNDELVTVSYSLKQKSDTKLVLIDHTGRVVQSIFSGSETSGDVEHHVNMQNLASGMYLVMITMDGASMSSKIIKY